MQSTTQNDKNLLLCLNLLFQGKFDHDCMNSYVNLDACRLLRRVRDLSETEGGFVSGVFQMVDYWHSHVMGGQCSRCYLAYLIGNRWLANLELERFMRIVAPVLSP